MSDVTADEDDLEAPPPEATKRDRGLLKTLLVLGLITPVAAGLGAGIGIHLAGRIETTVTEKLKEKPEEAPELLYSGDMILKPLEPVVTNLADPVDVWIRLETAIVFANGALSNPDVTAGEIRQDILAFARTVPLTQLQGASALQHLREDLNERVAVRTNGQVSELIIEAMVVQ